MNRRQIERTSDKAAARKLGKAVTPSIAGHRAYLRGDSPVDCPHILGTPEQRGWSAGWFVAFDKHHPSRMDLPPAATADKGTALWKELERAPHAPLPPKPKRRKKPEAKIQKEIVAWMRSQGWAVAITDAGVLYRAGLGASCGIPPGWPDLTCCVPGGRFLGVEVKALGGRQSGLQKKLQAHFQQLGGAYVVVRSLGELQRRIQSFLA